LTTTSVALKSKSSSAKLTRNSKVFKTIIEAIKDKKGEDIISLDLRKIHEAVADFFVVCSADNTTQLKAIIDSIEDKMLTVCGERPYKQEGVKNSQWVLIDYVDIVVHVMHSQSRNFYKLEELWSDAVATIHDDK
jgi:ribosome-associated protein